MPRKVIRPSLGQRISPWTTSKYCLTPWASILSRRTWRTESLRSFWTSRRHTHRVGRMMHRSSSDPPKKCVLPEDRPPNAPLCGAGGGSAANTRAVGITSFGINDYSLDLLKWDRSALWTAVLVLLHEHPEVLRDAVQGRLLVGQLEPRALDRSEERR